MRGTECDYMHRTTHGPPRHRARRGAIKGSVLQLLAERPMHGYELISEFEERTGGRWRPSPGSVYPTLAQLEDEGLVRSFDDDGRKRFELTDAGRTWLAEHQDDEQLRRGSARGVGGRGDLRRLAGEIFGQLRQLGRFGTPAQLDRPRRSSPAPAPSSTPCSPSEAGAGRRGTEVRPGDTAGRGSRLRIWAVPVSFSRPPRAQMRVRDGSTPRWTRSRDPALLAVVRGR